jgi:hypothetical protein
MQYLYISYKVFVTAIIVLSFVNHFFVIETECCLWTGTEFIYVIYMNIYLPRAVPNCGQCRSHFKRWHICRTRGELLWSSCVAPVPELCGDSKVERLVFGFSLQRPGRSSGIIHMGFLVGIWHWDRLCPANSLFVTANCHLTKASYPFVVRVWYHWPFETASGPPVDSSIALCS